ncbi:MAG: tRNA (adenosine(37)-N6)-threonylcarbamoyltransferase complex ATPase subunit type 1 TsaE [Veillonellales bacterium]
MLIFKTNSPEDTFSFGQKMAGLVSAGDVFCLAGDLGAGKTLLTQGISAGLQVGDAVTSPTFAILNVYAAVLPIYHFDLYRLEHPAELTDIGFYEYIEGDGLAIIEWPDKFPAELPDEYLWIDIKTGDSPNERLLCLRPRGVRYEQFGEELKIIAGSCFRYSHPGV